MFWYAVDLRHFAVEIIDLLRTPHVSDRRSRTGVSRDPIWRNTFIPGDCSNGPGVYWYPLVESKRRRGGDLSRVLCDGF
jgi:hypothetical protein